MGNNYETWLRLNDSELKPFWDRIAQHRASQLKKVLKEKDVSHIEAVNALDWVLALPKEFENKKNVDIHRRNSI